MSDSSIKPELEIEQRNFNVKRFLLKYVKYWYLFVLSLAIALVVARYYNWIAAPLYRSSCRIIIKDENAGGEAILKELNDYKRNRNLENEIQILKSNSLIAKAASQLELGETYILQGKLKSTELYTKCPFQLKADTLTDAAAFYELDINILNSKQFELTYFLKNNDDKKKSAQYTFNKTITNELGTFKIVKRKSFDSTQFDNAAFDKKKFKIFFNPIENIVS
ncbi:MAG: Wzz/FepE/Etk N-terminal domain-containing protein, partial [Bacteroidia bacterium]